MGISIELMITKGSAVDKVFTFESASSVYVGRSDECTISFTEKTVSRFHCLFDIVPPAVKVRDFGSLNGTFVNNVLIGKREKGLSAEEARANPGILIDLHNNDTLRLGTDCELKVFVKSDLVCADCGKNIGLVPNDFVSMPEGTIFCCQCKEKHDKEVKQKKEQEKKGINTPKVVGLKPQENILLFRGYKTIKLLGRGGMGEVWLAENEHSGEICAIKRMLPKSAVVPEAKKLFLREAALAGQLVHNNIVRQYSFENRDDGIFIVMEYCDGGSVDDQMRKNNRLYTVDEALECIIQTLDGLEYAHKAEVVTRLPNGKAMATTGVVHRDFKPSNIFITNQNGMKIFKVADFGLAKSYETAGLSDHTRAGQIAGTPNFMPRQQVIDFRFSKPEVDVWASAASIYFMLTGYVPKQNNKKDPWLCAVSENAVPIRKRNPSIPVKLARVIDEALIDNPSIPFKSAKAFQNELLKL